MINSYPAARRYLEGFIPDTTNFNTMTLDRISYLCRALGNPQKNYPVIHIGGTSGKGSTATFAATMLKALGLKTGLHISPHLQSLTERMQINNIRIPELKFVSVVKKIQPFVVQTEKIGLGSPTYFEILVALSFWYFAQEKVDAAAIEVGLGGTHDGTNIIGPSVAILTNISLDHTQILGKTVVKILKDKQGIIKSNSPGVVSGVTQPSLRKQLSTYCANLGVRLKLLGREFPLADTKLKLRGSFQKQNFTLAREAVKLFTATYFPRLSQKVDRAAKITAQTAYLPGRFEVISTSPLVLLDGAHNKAKMKALTSALAETYPQQKWLVVMAVKKDKAYGTLISLLRPFTDSFFFTRFTQMTDAGPALALSPITLQASAAKSQVFISVQSAYQSALKKAEARKLPILVTGSLYLVGEVRNMLHLRPYA
jgi:dihydrofolate synthase/folylpolyglutamate synthase